MSNKLQTGTLLLVVLMLVGLLTGCGNSGVKDTASSAGNASSASNAEGDSKAPSADYSSEPSVDTVELTISAAVSLTDALKEIQTAFEAQHPNIQLTFNFGASGTLQQQIEQGAPADLFLSASAKNMQALVDNQLIDSSQEMNLLNNELVVITPGGKKESVHNLEDLKQSGVTTVAIGIPESVPAGNYAKEALEASGLWDSLQSKTVQGKDVRQVLQYVETGNADAGFVYKTDALTSENVNIAFSVEPSAYKAIQYPIGIVKATKHSGEAEAFYQYLQSKETLDVFVKYGFSIPQK